MSYTTIDQVAGMFPAFKRGTAQQTPPDTLIQQYIDDVAGDINAVLNRRFGEAIGGYSSFAAFTNALSSDALNVLEKINRYGAAAQLGQTLSSFGVSAARNLAQDFHAQYDELIGQLNARDKDGKPMPAGMYDHLFDSEARTESPRPALEGVAGGDQPEDQAPADTGSSQVFGKFDRRGT
ncbi:MAG TPA: hypothetical protein VGW33_15390 [Terriglobia bacterium]|nr:hypothetical protein [Terriglobia bacterium]